MSLSIFRYLTPARSAGVGAVRATAASCRSSSLVYPFTARGISSTGPTSTKSGSEPGTAQAASTTTTTTTTATGTGQSSDSASTLTSGIAAGDGSATSASTVSSSPSIPPSAASSSSSTPSASSSASTPPPAPHSLGGAIPARTKKRYDVVPANMKIPIESPDDIPKTPFQVGKKQLHLPWHIVSLMKSPTLPATWAKFQVPLRFGKLDLRDYLWHMYGVYAVRVRSFVKQCSPQLRDGKRWFRPQSKKYMVIQMDEPFYWPDDPTDFKDWSKDLYKYSTATDRTMKVTPKSRVSEQNMSLIHLEAERIRQAKAKWAPSPATYANPAFSKAPKPPRGGHAA